MYVLLKIKRSKYREIRRKIGQVRYRKYDLPDHLPVGLNFVFISELKGLRKEKVPISIVRDGTL
jgi:hypothetical protein